MSCKASIMPCKDCFHKEVCRYKEEYETFLNETLKDAFDMMPKFCDIHVDCKHAYTSSGIMRCDFKEGLR